MLGGLGPFCLQLSLEWFCFEDFAVWSGFPEIPLYVLALLSISSFSWDFTIWAGCWDSTMFWPCWVFTVCSDFVEIEIPLYVLSLLKFLYMFWLCWQVHCMLQLCCESTVCSSSVESPLYVLALLQTKLSRLWSRELWRGWRWICRTHGTGRRRGRRGCWTGCPGWRQFPIGAAIWWAYNT